MMFRFTTIGLLLCFSTIVSADGFSIAIDDTLVERYGTRTFSTIGELCDELGLKRRNITSHYSFNGTIKTTACACGYKIDVNGKANVRGSISGITTRSDFHGCLKLNGTVLLSDSAGTWSATSNLQITGFELHGIELVPAKGQRFAPQELLDLGARVIAQVVDHQPAVATSYLNRFFQSKVNKATTDKIHDAIKKAQVSLENSSTAKNVGRIEIKKVDKHVEISVPASDHQELPTIKIRYDNDNKEIVFSGSVDAVSELSRTLTSLPPQKELPKKLDERYGMVTSVTSVSWKEDENRQDFLITIKVNIRAHVSIQEIESFEGTIHLVFSRDNLGVRKDRDKEPMIEVTPTKQATASVKTRLLHAAQGICNLSDSNRIAYLMEKGFDAPQSTEQFKFDRSASEERQKRLRTEFLGQWTKLRDELGWKRVRTKSLEIYKGGFRQVFTVAPK